MQNFRVTFVEEARGMRLSKGVYLNDQGAVDTSNYYQTAKRFTSHTQVVSTIEEFHTFLKASADEGWALVKGNYDRDIVRESRAGRADKNEPTQWICLDFDGTDEEDPQVLLNSLGMGGVSHIIQYSASHGLTPGKLRAHIFMLLDTPISETQLKQWFMWMNLTVPALSESMTLTASRNSLKWPLDISLAEPHRLIYIAHPDFTDVKDPFAAGGPCEHLDRIALVQGVQPAFQISTALRTAQLHTVDQRKAEKRDQLRSAAGLRKKQEKLTYVKRHNTHVLSNPDAATVTGIKVDRGFVYLNLNGGDSWGYFHPVGNPDVIYNFKGEPNYLAKDLLPDYYTEAVNNAAAAGDPAPVRERAENAEATKETLRFVFCDAATGQYYKASWDPATGRRSINPARNKEQLNDYCLQYGLEVPDFIPEMEMKFDPTDSLFLNKEGTIVNSYFPSEYQIGARSAEPVYDIPPTIGKIIRHVVGDDKHCYDRFLHWLAYVWQTGRKPKVAWIFQGTTGTGKGTLFDKVIKPLFGTQHCNQVSTAQIEDQFNGWLERCRMCLIDETDMDSQRDENRAAATVRTYITDDMFSLRAMRQTARPLPNYTAFMASSNQWNVWKVEGNDRRWSVGRRQEKKLGEVLEDHEFALIESELKDFASYLQHFMVNITKATTPLMNEAKEAMQDSVKDTPVEMIEALESGNFRYFVDQLPISNTDLAPSTSTSDEVIDFRRQLNVIFFQLQRVRSVEGLRTVKVAMPRDDLYDIARYILGWKNMSATKFSKALSRFGLRMQTVLALNGKRVRGAYFTWQATEDDMEFARDLIKPPATRSVVPLRPERERETSNT